MGRSSLERSSLGRSMLLRARRPTCLLLLEEEGAPDSLKARTGRAEVREAGKKERGKERKLKMICVCV